MKDCFLNAIYNLQISVVSLQILKHVCSLLSNAQDETFTVLLSPTPFPKKACLQANLISAMQRLPKLELIKISYIVFAKYQQHYMNDSIFVFF